MNHTHHGHDAAWDHHAEQYAKEADRIEPALRIATEALLDAVHVLSGTRLLDLACGPGHNTAAAQARGAQAVGLDLSHAMVGQAQQRFPATRFLVGDMAQPPPGPWDAITCRFGAHHAGSAWLDVAHRILRAGGRLAIAEVTADGGDHGPHGKVDPVEWRRRLEAAGFEGVTIQPIAIELPPVAHEHGKPPRKWPSTWIITGRKPGDA